MAEALCKLRHSELQGFTISKTQMVIQITAGFFYALSNTFYLLLPHGIIPITTYVEFSLDSISLFTLTYTLSHIAALQFNDQIEQGTDVEG
jgi:hypothetical protein